MCRFLLASLSIEIILEEVTIVRRRKKLEEIAQGNGLEDAYASNLDRLKAQKGSRAALGQRALMWVLNSERPIRAKELCHALGVKIGAPDLHPENVPALKTLLASCLGLVTVEESSSIVRLVHFTLEEHLANDPTLFHSSHSTIAEVCLTYLNFRSIRDLSPTLDSAPATMPLLEYASVYWGEHARRGMTENIKLLALRLLDIFDEHISAKLLLLRDFGWLLNSSSKAGGATGFTGLHGVAFLGIAEMVVPVLEMKGWDINAVDSTGSTALIWAARLGHEEAMKVLLEAEGVNPDQADTRYDQTPLSCAAENGHEGIVKILLERTDVNPDRASTRMEWTPLSQAAERGHEGIVKILLERKEVNPNQANTHTAEFGGGNANCNNNNTDYGHDNFNCGNVDNSHNTYNYNSDEDANIMSWLSPLRPGNRHHDVRTKRFEGAGDWLLETREFQEWRRGDGGHDRAVLFCSGDPGVGKTYLR